MIFFGKNNLFDYEWTWYRIRRVDLQIEFKTSPGGAGVDQSGWRNKEKVCSESLKNRQKYDFHHNALEFQIMFQTFLSKRKKKKKPLSYKMSQKSRYVVSFRFD